jgi:hypothetical protein
MGQKNTLQTIARRQANCTGHILRRNCLLDYVIEVKTKEIGGGEIRLKYPLDELKNVDCTLCRTTFGRAYGPVARRNKR